MAQGAEDFDDDDEAFESFSDAGSRAHRARTRPDRSRGGAARARLASSRRRAVRCRCRSNPSHIELRGADGAGADLRRGAVRPADSGPVLDCIAECGAVVWCSGPCGANAPDDVRLAARLLAARVPFEILCGTWPEVFMAQAHAELQGFMPRPPESPVHPSHRTARRAAMTEPSRFFTGSPRKSSPSSAAIRRRISRHCARMWSASRPQ